MKPEQAQLACDFIVTAFGLADWRVTLHTYPAREVSDGWLATCHTNASTLVATVHLALESDDPFGNLVHELLHVMQAEVEASNERALTQLSAQAAEIGRLDLRQSGERQVYRLERWVTPLLRSAWEAVKADGD